MFSVYMADLVEANDSGLKGTISFEVKGKEAWIRGSIVKDPFKRELMPGGHGFQIHTFGSVTNDCMDAGPVFNPKGVT